MNIGQKNELSQNVSTLTEERAYYPRQMVLRAQDSINEDKIKDSKTS